MNGNHGNDYSGLGQLQAQAAQTYWQGQLAGPKSIMQQLRDKVAELKANLARVDGWKAELAQAERMLAAAEEPTNG